MAAATAVDPLFRGTTSKNTRGLLRIIILCTIAAAAVSARLFSVIRMPFIPLVVLCQMNELGC
jgi:dolichyl-diphosphooligosaccharide--protein glycosyltransferase